MYFLIISSHNYFFVVKSTQCWLFSKKISWCIGETVNCLSVIHAATCENIFAHRATHEMHLLLRLREPALSTCKIGPHFWTSVVITFVLNWHCNRNFIIIAAFLKEFYKAYKLQILYSTCGKGGRYHNMNRCILYR